MNISATGGASAAYPTQSTQRTLESAEVKRVGRDGDGDADDGGAKAVSVPQPYISKPTAIKGNNVNTVA